MGERDPQYVHINTSKKNYKLFSDFEMVRE